MKTFEIFQKLSLRFQRTLIYLFSNINHVEDRYLPIINPHLSHINVFLVS